MNTAVLFLIFNRPETTTKAFSALRAAQPKKLYIASDGPRKEVEGEAARCAEARSIAASIDWPCEVRQLYREEHLGCRKAVSEAISWFFESEEEGIILEDDIVPNLSFFQYCTEMLERYRSHPEIMAVCGGGYIHEHNCAEASYWFSHTFDPWGWATWRRAWNLYNDEISDFDELLNSRPIKKIFRDVNQARSYWLCEFQKASEGLLDTWGYRWTKTIFENHGLVIYPRTNLVSNIGFGQKATHTRDATSRLSELQAFALPQPFIEPESISVLPELDRELYLRRLGVRHLGLISRSRKAFLQIASRPTGRARILCSRFYEIFRRARNGFHVL